jgi:hypothetical protein
LVDQLSDCTWRVWPRSLRATPLVSMSKMTTMPSCYGLVSRTAQAQVRRAHTRPEASRSPRWLKRIDVEWPLPAKGESRSQQAQWGTGSRRRPVITSGQSCARMKGSTSDKFIVRRRRAGCADTGSRAQRAASSQTQRPSMRAEWKAAASNLVGALVRRVCLQLSCWDVVKLHRKGPSAAQCQAMRLPFVPL